ncbi:MarR family transcriptional regulator [Agrococcus lahaulensis]|nr:MarR family transcriptional regulator [Agrococcus lahaulensis]
MGARRMLHAIVRADAARSISDLGRDIGVDQPRASRLVQGLAEAGLVRRIPDPADGRRVVIEATAAGRRHVAEHAEARAAEVATAAEALSPAERATLAALLTRLADAWPPR